MNDPHGAIGYLKDNHFSLYEILLLMDKAASGLLFDDPTHTISYHIAMMASVGNPFGLVLCEALNALSPNHCQTALNNEIL
jgi:hypothetical protein